MFRWRATQAASGREAIERLRTASRPFDILLLDRHMPEMDGLKMLQVAAGEPTITVPPVVLMIYTGDGGDLRRHDGGIHVAQVITKPIIPSTLLDAVIRVRAGKAPPRHNTGISGRLRGARLLVVDDNEINRQLALTILRRAGARVEAVNSGEAAVETLRQGTAFDAVLMDVQMPGMNGYEATKAIRNLPGVDTLRSSP